MLAPPRSPRRTSRDPCGTVVEPSWNLTSDPPRTTAEPIWAETPKLSAVGEQRQQNRKKGVHSLNRKKGVHKQYNRKTEAHSLSRAWRLTSLHIANDMDFSIYPNRSRERTEGAPSISQFAVWRVVCRKQWLALARLRHFRRAAEASASASVSLRRLWVEPASLSSVDCLDQPSLAL